MAKHDNYVIQGNTLDAIASEVKTLADTSDKMTVSQIAFNIAQANTDVSTQTDLIAQIKTALEGKAAGSGSEIVAEIVSLIDQSGVLDSTEGSVTEKVEKLIDKAEWEEVWYDASSCWTDNTNLLFYKNDKIKILPRINFENVTTMRYFIGYSTLERVDYYINTAKATNFYQAFMSCKKLKTIVGIDISNASSDGVYEMFKSCESLETIQEPLDFSTVLANMSGVFIGCYALKNVRFEKNCINCTINFTNCSKLTAESVQSIIDGLATVETAQTLTLHKNVKAKLTEEQLATITNKNWNLA